MSIELLMPKLGLTMNEGKIIKWHKEVGDKVNIGDALYDIETDKLTNTIEAQDEGYLGKIIGEIGVDIPVSNTIGILVSSMDEEIMVNDNVEDEEKISYEKKMDNNAKKKVIVIGGGPGGYVSAIRLSQLGADVTLVEKNKIGGTCLNVGCIPTKVLLRTSELYDEILKSEKIGIDINGSISVNWNKLRGRKEDIITKLVEGTSALLKANGINVIDGIGTFVDRNTINILKENGQIEELFADCIIIATGSSSFIPPIEGVNLNGVINSDDALSLDELPDDIVIIGGGVIGVEFGSVFNSLGVETKIIEMLPYILPPIDREISRNVCYVLEEKGMEINTSAKVLKIKQNGSKLITVFEKDGKNIEVESEKVLVSSGRIPYLDGLNLENAGINYEKSITVNETMKTNVDNIYAVGDVTGKNLLAHVAFEQGIVAAENIMGIESKMKYSSIPSCIYISPEIASIGYTEERAKEENIDYNIGIFNLIGNGKALILDQQNGTMVKIISDKKYGEIIGAHIYGPSATELINEFSLAMSLEATVDEMIATIHAHPTVAESINEASLASKNRMIHGINKK